MEPQTAGRTKRGRGDLPRKSDMEDGIRLEPQFHSVLTWHRLLCSCRWLHSAARRSPHLLFSRLLLAGRPISLPPRSLCVCRIFSPLMDGVKFVQSVAPNSRLHVFRCTSPSEGSSDVLMCSRWSLSCFFFFSSAAHLPEMQSVFEDRRMFAPHAAA